MGSEELQVASVVASRTAYLDFRSAKLRIAGVHLDESAHGIASVESGLRSAKHLDAFHSEEVEVESRLVGIGGIVHVETYGRSVDSRTYTSYIYGACEF